MKSFDTKSVPKKYWMSSDAVVQCSLDSLSGKRVIVIPGLRYRILGRLMQMPLVQPFGPEDCESQSRIAAQSAGTKCISAGWLVSELGPNRPQFLRGLPTTQ